MHYISAIAAASWHILKKRSWHFIFITREPQAHSLRLRIADHEVQDGRSLHANSPTLICHNHISEDNNDQ
jgi:hypothetical protein